MPNESNSPLWDYEGVVASLGGRREIVNKLISLFVDKLPEQLETLQQSLAAGDLGTIERVAHSIKGSAAQFKASILAQHAAALEAAAHAGDWEAIRGKHPEVETACGELMHEIKAFLAAPAA